MQIDRRMCDADPMIENTWDTVAFPLLERAAKHFTGSDNKLWMSELTDTPFDAIDDALMQREIKQLEDDGYLKLDRRAGHVTAINGVTAKAKRTVGEWPNDETVGAALISAFEKMAEKEDHPERRKALRQAAASVGEIGVSGFGQLFGAVLRQLSGF